MTTVELIRTFSLPPGLIEVKLPNDFNEKIPTGFFYEGIKEITFGDNFNQPISKGVLPEGLT